MSSLEEIHAKLNGFKRKYCKRQVISGLLIFLITSLSLFLLLSYLEHQFWMSSAVRTAMLFVFLIFLVSGLIFLIIRPLMRYFSANQSLDNKQVAKEVAIHFPEIEDRLVNLLELGDQTDEENALMQFSSQKYYASPGSIR